MARRRKSPPDPNPSAWHCIPSVFPADHRKEGREQYPDDGRRGRAMARPVAFPLPAGEKRISASKKRPFNVEMCCRTVTWIRFGRGCRQRNSARQNRVGSGSAAEFGTCLFGRRYLPLFYAFRITIYFTIDIIAFTYYVGANLTSARGDAIGVQQSEEVIPARSRRDDGKPRQPEITVRCGLMGDDQCPIGRCAALAPHDSAARRSFSGYN